MLMTNPPSPWLRACLLAALLPGLAACKGSSADISGTGSPKSAVVSGEVEAFGSLRVAGTRYTTDASTTITLDGAPAPLDALAVGMVVELRLPAALLGVDGATVEAVAFDSLLEAPLESVDGDRLRLLGQVVRVDDLTRVRDAQGARLALTALQVGDRLRVSGYRQANGEILATLLQRRPAQAEAVLSGVATQVDRGALRFALRGTPVDYSAAASIDLDEGLQNGDRVAVRGRFADGVLRADALRELEALDEDDDDGEPPAPRTLEGTVQTLGGSCPQRRLQLRDLSIALDAQTRYSGGGCADLALGQRLRVEVEAQPANGDATNRLRARLVTLPATPDALLRAPIEGIEAGNSAGACTLRFAGGLLVAVGADTRLDGDDADEDSPGCAQLRSGEVVSIVGRYDAAARRITALLLEPVDAGPALAVGGALEAVDAAAGRLQILGLAVQDNAQTRYDDGEQRLQRSEFYAGLQTGAAVLALGRYDGAVLQAARLSRGEGRRVDEAEDEDGPRERDGDAGSGAGDADSTEGDTDPTEGDADPAEGGGG